MINNNKKMRVQCSNFSEELRERRKRGCRVHNMCMCMYACMFMCMYVYVCVCMCMFRERGKSCCPVHDVF